MTAVPHVAPGRAVSRLAVRQVRRGAIGVALVCGVMSAVVASQYQVINSLLDESAMRAMAGNPAEKILLGPPVALDNPGGFTVWRTGTLILVLVSLWIILTTTRITRGEEDAGRWGLLLAGRLRMEDLVVRCLTALAASAMLIGVTVATGLSAARTELAGALLYASGITLVALTFATTALLAAQIMPARSGATALSVAALGVGLTLRMAADSSPGLAWLAWVTPFGLAARAAPYADNRALPLAVLSAFPIALAGATLLTARHRDLGDGIVTVPPSRPPRTRLLRNIGGFALRRAARITFGWAVGVAAFFLLMGALLALVLEFFQTNPHIAELAADAGISSSFDSVNVFAAPLFSLLPVATGLYAAMRLATFVADEQVGRWTLLFAQPISRVRLMSAEIAVTACAVLALHCTAAVAMWSGAKITGAPLQFPDALAGALNSLPVALLAAGAAAVGVGWFPSAAGAIGALPLVGGFLVNAIMQTTNVPRWVANLSPWAHLAAVPEVPPHWTATIILVLIGTILTALGVCGYVRRDVAT
ncbi:ABC transporter [Mycobacterium sp. IS-1556]|uniref:ABC transporter permease n=1 Tax=Mycobacterium sp. IS-1556 TaxID=1772276 RepID=UPI0025706855|nr:ABC transporter [Mycobacterium sp. IS-1556]